MRCKQIRKMLGRYVDEELDPAYRKNVSEHLASCDSCGREYAALMRMKGMFSMLESKALPTSLWPKIAKRLREQSSVQPLWIFGESFTRRLIPITVAALLVVGFFIFSPREQNRQQVALDAALIDATFSPEEKAIIVDGENPEDVILLTSVYGDYGE